MQQDPVASEREESFQTGFSLPALEIPNKHYSLEADMVTGWQPKMKVVGPVPLNFDASVCDEVVETLTTFGNRHHQRVVYLGPRYASSFKLHQQLKRDYHYKYEAIINTNFPHLAAYFRKFYGHFKPKHTRPFRGMNPTLPPHQSAIFDAGFQSANLDAAIKISPNEYDLFMRVDSNTRGHLQWFNFTVRGSSSIRKIRLNIVNFRRSRTLYNSGMKPYYWSSLKRGSWKQGGSEVRYQQKPLRYAFLNNRFSEERLTYNCLSFEYEFEEQSQIVQFAYCPPFTYSQNAKMIAYLQSSLSLLGCPQILKEQVAGETLGGVDLPLLTITDPSVPDAFKSCIVASARIHPGQTCGSFMIKGFLEFICSNDPIAIQLRKRIVFKVLPMANPDGVITGNFRTSLCGRDLNRMFKSQEALLIPQVVALKEIVRKLKSQYKNRLLFFLDFHGHSVRKNVFIYGPQYEIWEPNYYRTRILPKLISEKTEMFRYYSCIFRISSQKKTTARAVLMRHVPHCYTVQASVGSYFCHSQKKDYQFTPASWQNMGKIVAQGIMEYFRLNNQQSVKSKERQMLKNEIKESSLPKVRISGSRTRKKINQPKGLIEDIRKTNIQQPKTVREDKQGFVDDNNDLNEGAKQIIQQIKQQQKAFHENAEKYSEGGSDSESSNDDLPQKQLTTLHHQIILSLKEFKDRFYNRGDSGKARSFLQSSVHMQPKKIEMIASLRRKAEQSLTSKSQLVTERIANSSGQSSKIWVRGRSSRRSSGYQVSESESFHVYVTKLKAVREEEEKCRVSYFSPRKKLAYS